MDFLKIVVAVRRALSVVQVFTDKAERDAHYFFCVAPALGLSGMVGLSLSVHLTNDLIAAEIGAGSCLLTIPVALWVAGKTWKQRLRRSLPTVQIDRYIDAHELAYYDYLRDLKAINDAALPPPDALRQRNKALETYLGYSKQLRAALWANAAMPPLPPSSQGQLPPL